jgi:hypothetical protein
MHTCGKLTVSIPERCQLGWEGGCTQATAVKAAHKSQSCHFFWGEGFRRDLEEWQRKSSLSGLSEAEGEVATAVSPVEMSGR